MPNVVLEAMAAGRAVIASRVEGIQELIRDRESGLIVTPESPTELASAIQQMISDRSLVADAGRKSQQTVAKDFTIQSNCLAYVSLYRRLLDIS
jgi:glycosyltransferase involved in cell wall biosynthesis